MEVNHVVDECMATLEEEEFREEARKPNTLRKDGQGRVRHKKRKVTL